MQEILLVNGPNLNLLGVREPGIYGDTSLGQIEALVTEVARVLDYRVVCFQSNHEGAIIDFLQDHREAIGIIMNPGAFTHYSYGIRDCLAAVNVPAIEVHISHIHTREEFRHRSVIAPVCIGQISGLGVKGYELALLGLVDHVKKERMIPNDICQ